MPSPDDLPPNFSQDIKRIARILREGGYSYNQSKYLISEARKQIGLKRPKSKKGSVERLTYEELTAFMEAAYNYSGVRGLLVRTLFETGGRVTAFCKMKAEHIDFVEPEIFFPEDKGDKAGYVPILPSLARELKVHLGNRRTGYVFLSRQGGHYSRRRIEQIVKEIAYSAGITKNVYPHLLRHTIAQFLADQGMPENHLQKFLRHDSPQTTQIYYETGRPQVKASYRAAMKNLPS